MIEVVAIVEGSTEQTFVSRVLAAHLSARGIAMWGVLSGKARKQGGIPKWASAKADLVRTLKEDRFCTTMFDFYGMPSDWPGREKAAKATFDQRGQRVENEIMDAIAVEMGRKWDRRRFIPYVQVHEFEALLFANPAIVAEAAAANISASQVAVREGLESILQTKGDPEAINDGKDTCPSRRIAGLMKGYRKRWHGPIIAERIGLDVLRAKCRHFGQWLTKLENLSQSEIAT